MSEAFQRASVVADPCALHLRVFLFCAGQRSAQPLRHGRRFLRGRTRLLLLLRRHLAGLDAVMDLHPAREALRIAEVRLERSEVEVSLLRLRVVALRSMFLDEDPRRRVGAESGQTEHSHGESGGDSGRHRNERNGHGKKATRERRSKAHEKGP